MYITINAVHIENLPALRFIGKRCECGPEDFIASWDEWFEKGWFDQLEKLGAAPENANARWGMTAGDEYWIGMLFAPGASAPDGFLYMDRPAAKYAVLGLSGRRDKDLLGEEGITLVMDEAGKRGWTLSGDGWGLERYNCVQSAASGKMIKTLVAFMNQID